jgi:hypothetical protein
MENYLREFKAVRIRLNKVREISKSREFKASENEYDCTTRNLHMVSYFIVTNNVK